MKKFLNRKFVAVMLVLVMILSSAEVASATTIQNAENKKAEAQSSLNSVNSKINNIESQQAALQSQINALDADLVQVLLNIDVIKSQIAEKEVELAQLEKDLEAAKAKEAEQYEAMKQRIRYLYENGNETYLTAILSADSIADVLNKTEYATEIYECDRTMLIEYQNTKVEVQNLKIQVEEEKAELEEGKAALEAEEANLQAMIKQKESQMDDFASQLAAARDLAAQYKATIDQQNNIIAEAYAAQRAAEQAQQNNRTGAGATGGGGGQSNGGGGNAANNGGGASSNDGGGSSSGGSSGGGSYTPPPSSGAGGGVASYAQQFVGNPYVWGGTSLTNGADCSGFVMSVYAHYGVSLPHSSSAMRSVGYAVSAADMQPGDIVCYSGHVAIYIGGGAIVHASNPSDGIKVSGNYAYRDVVAIRRVI